MDIPFDYEHEHRCAEHEHELGLSWIAIHHVGARTTEGFAPILGQMYLQRGSLYSGSYSLNEPNRRKRGAAASQ